MQTSHTSFCVSSDLDGICMLTAHCTKSIKLKDESSGYNCDGKLLAFISLCQNQ
ncbi:MAG: hypothetical protein MK329_01440 [Pirellulales bacterium]|nr:hypothetical protein [Pirellulales bacterium]